ncbi:MAG TPA: glycosyltransferase [Cyclobacteriaceae bacterium]|nr:glycosyltransferase [Cyclobacteriaceae bacterium]
MKASIVISYYKNIPNLELILFGLSNQSARGAFEVIVSEDDDAKETVDFLNIVKQKVPFPIIHLSQKDEGFLKCKALNKAIEASTSDFLIFLDGDCIPHPHLVKEYIETKRPGRAQYGRRVMLSEKISKDLLSRKSLNVLNFFNLVRCGCKRVEEGLYLTFVPQALKKKSTGLLLGCNMGISKSDLVAINGFDEDYVAPGGGEDSDVEWRLSALGTVSFYSMKFRSIVYHIHHQERFSKNQELKNEGILARKMQEGFFRCKNGLKKE